MRLRVYISLLLVGQLLLSSCGDESGGGEGPMIDPNDLTQISHDPQAYDLDIPESFPEMDIPEDNPMTEEGVLLGRHLFYDPIMSRDSSISCSTCHLPQGNFTDNLDKSLGIDGNRTSRSSMSLLNVGFVNTGLFWDGRIMTLEDQAIIPVEDPIEHHEDWGNVESKLRSHPDYPTLFRKAFDIAEKSDINRGLTTKAIAQFERSLVSSGNSKYDRVIAGDAVFTDEELQGHDIFFDINADISRHAECGHCHNAPLFTTNEFFNNGVQVPVEENAFEDNGLGSFTGRVFDNGMFRTPSLRNIFISGPFMHDGSFATMDEVLDHYITGGHPTANLDPVLRPLSLSAEDRASLLAFIRTLEDLDFVNNPSHQSPF